jgi:muramoyltetrapeptide carboxypeptidase LdcA involved in peptidoglycan recycling
MPEFVVPPPAEPGDSVAVVAPASGHAAAFPHVYEHGLKRLESVFDLEPVEYPTATMDDETLYANPEQRAQDIMDAFRDPEIRAIIATIGGNDQIRILEHLDEDVLRANPTRFFGISDNANAALVLYNQGIVSYYGGLLMTTFAMQGGMREYSVEHLERALFEDRIGEIQPAERFTDHDLDWADPANLDREREFEPNPGWRWAGGDEAVEGRVWGGCLTVLDGFLAADRWMPPISELAGNVLLLETSELLPTAEQVRSMLLPMGERGLLGAIDGVIVGRAKARAPGTERSAEERAAYRERQRTVIEEVFAEYNPDAPIVFDVDVGHTAPEVPVPIGGQARIDPQAEQLVFE